MRCLKRYIAREVFPPPARSRARPGHARRLSGHPEVVTEGHRVAWWPESLSLRRTPRLWTMSRAVLPRRCRSPSAGPVFRCRVGRFLGDLPLRWGDQRVLIVGHSATRWGLEHFIGGVPLEELAEQHSAWRDGWEYRLRTGLVARSGQTHRCGTMWLLHVGAAYILLHSLPSRPTGFIHCSEKCYSDSVRGGAAVAQAGSDVCGAEA
jgi:hypothetical protein